MVEQGKSQECSVFLVIFSVLNCLQPQLQKKKLETEGRGAEDQSELDQPRAPPAPFDRAPPRPGREPVADCPARSPDPA
jgi:hypothetical protein